MTGFSANDGKGFTVTFATGVTVSAQFGAGNYCEHRNGMIGSERRKGYHISPDAEIAIIGPAPERDWLTKEWKPDHGDDVMGWVDPATWLEALNWAASYDPATSKSGLAPTLGES